MHSPIPSRRGTGAALAAVALAAFTAVTFAATDASREAAFHAENVVAMHRMMEGMEIKPSGNVDLDFARMMIAHHQGAIDMALAELRYGRNERLRRLAQQIIVDQRQEIEAMQMVIHRELQPADSTPAANHAAAASEPAAPHTAHASKP